MKKKSELFKDIHLISGGQTGVDRAALDFALDYQISCGGYCPKGRLAEDGRIHDRYPLKELSSEIYADRTSKNVSISDGVLVFKLQWDLDEGTIYTLDCAKELGKPIFILERNHGGIYHWLVSNKIQHLNISGPRENCAPGIYNAAYNSLIEIHRIE